MNHSIFLSLLGRQKPDSELLPGENAEPTMGMLSEEQPIFKRKLGKTPVLATDYLNGLLNPFMRLWIMCMA